MCKKMVFAMLVAVAVVCSAQAGTVFMAYTNSSYGTGTNWYPSGPIPTAAETAEIRYNCTVDTQVTAPNKFYIGTTQAVTLTISGSGGFTTAVGSDYSYVGNGYDGTINLENSSTLTMGPLFLGNYNNPGGTGTLNVTGGGTLITSSLLVGWSALGVANIVNGTVQATDLNIGTYSANNKVFIGEFGTLKFAYNSGGYGSNLQAAFDAWKANGRLYTRPGRALQLSIVSGWAIVTSYKLSHADGCFLGTVNSSWGNSSNWDTDLVPTVLDMAYILVPVVVDTQVAAPKAFWIGVYGGEATMTISGYGGFNAAGGALYSYAGSNYSATINLANSSTMDVGAALFLGHPDVAGTTGTLNVTGGGTFVTDSLQVGYGLGIGDVNIVNGMVQAYDLNIWKDANDTTDSRIFIGEFGKLQFYYNSGEYGSDLQAAFDDFVADGRLYTSTGRILVCELAGGLKATVGSVPEDTNGCDATWTAGNDVAAPVFTGYDLAASVGVDGGYVYTFDPRPYLNLAVYKGTTVDNLTYQYNGALDGSFTQPHGDDAYWLGGGLWVDPATGKWYTLCEIEFNYYPSVGENPYGRTGLATSTDKGHTWHYEGDVIVGDNPQNRKYFACDWRDVGDTFTNLFINANDGYFYAVTGHGWQLSTGGDDSASRIARSPITSKMAPGTWTKWYDGAWSQPGLGGHSSDILTNAGVTYIGYNTYLGKYIAMGNRWLNGVGMISEISVCDSMETQNWSPAQRFLEQDLTEYSARLLWYHWAWDPATNSRDRLGQTFRLYTTQGGYGGVGAKYIPITLGAGTTLGLGFTSMYPTVSVPDYNPEYDQDADLYLPATLRSDFSGGSSAGWATGIGGGWSVTGIATQGLSVPANTSVINTAATSCTSGIIWFTAQSDDATRKFTAYFRYVNSGSYAAITYDNGVIGWKTAAGSGSLVSITPFATGSTHRFKILFDASNFVVIYIDGGAVYFDTVDDIPVQSGTWGLGSGASATNLFDNAAIAPLP